MVAVRGVVIETPDAGSLTANVPAHTPRMHDTLTVTGTGVSFDPERKAVPDTCVTSGPGVMVIAPTPPAR